MFNAENFMKIGQGMTSEECVENKWFNMKYIGEYLSVEILLTHECISMEIANIRAHKVILDAFFLFSNSMK